MSNKRYIPAKALKISDTEYIPFWELKFVNCEMYGDGYMHGECYETYHHNLSDCYWDTKKHKLLLGIVKDVYPQKTEFNKEEEVYVEAKNNSFREDKIVEIVYEEYGSQIKSVKNVIDNNELRFYFSKKEQKNLDVNAIYEFRNWKAYYILEGGEKIKWDHKLKHKVNE